MANLPTLPFGTPLTGASAGEWAVAILNAVPAPITDANVYSLAGWFEREGGGGVNNPMNTTLGSQYPYINSDHVRSFPTPEIGVEETVATLENGYSNVLAMFKSGAGLAAPSLAAQAELRKWSGGGYSFIDPLPVPYTRPAPPDPNHYAYYDNTEFELDGSKNSELRVVKNYDAARAKGTKIDPANHKHLGQLVERIEKNMDEDHDPKGLKYHRAFRIAEINARVKGERVAV